ncbi:endothelin-converting enzyme 1-like [Rhipicephalus sanguineus]|uniref:endothelin-converting enzyme 1-like n=1 Tax=Rhipicephalus sanguineus TaxID=34632 RepID=UPI0018933192|nr:endothelin-converting enzyme 1-like [Rhipicephalus sanguineus]
MMESARAHEQEEAEEEIAGSRSAGLAAVPCKGPWRTASSNEAKTKSVDPSMSEGDETLWTALDSTPPLELPKRPASPPSAHVESAFRFSRLSRSRRSSEHSRRISSLLYQSRKHSSCIFFYGAVLLSLVVLASFVVLFFLRDIKAAIVARRAVDVCGTDDCMMHASELRARMNTAADPCHSLHAFVCGGAPRATQRSEERRSARIYGEVMAYDSQKYRTAGNCSHQESHADVKALSAYTTCLERTSQPSSETEVQAIHFTDFMKARRIPWPNDPPENVDLLDVLLDLVLNWRVALLFDLRRSTRKFHTASFVFQEPGPLIELRRQQVAHVYEVEKNTEHLVLTAAMFLGSSGEDMSKEKIDALRRDEMTLASNLAACSDERGNDVLVTLKHIEELAPNANSTSWLTLLKRHLHDKSLTSETKVFVYDEQRLKALSEALTLLPAARSLNVIGWMFAYTYMWVVNPAFDQLQPSDDNESDYSLNKTLCFLAVHESFGLLQILHNFVKRFEHGDIQMTSKVLQNTVDTFARLVQKSDTITETTKATAVEKISSVCQERCTVRVSNRRLLDWLYRSFPNSSSSFFDTWLSTRKALVTLLKSGDPHPVMTARFAWRNRNIHYLHTINFQQVRMFAFYPPSFYIHGSPSMSYSGLGFQMASSIVKAIVGHGRGIDENLSKRFWWSSLKSCRWDESSSPHEKRFIEELFALKLAVKALESAVGSDKAFLQLRSLETLTGRQTFYVSYCSRFCYRVDGENWCNLAMHEEGYIRAFGCHSAWARYSTVEPECLVV